MSEPHWPLKALASVTKDDAADLPGGSCRCLLVGAAGTANIVDGEGNVVTGVPLQQGYNPIIVRRVMLGGTASDIWAGY
jgi:hypothetical protein